MHALLNQLILLSPQVEKYNGIISITTEFPFFALSNKTLAIE